MTRRRDCLVGLAAGFGGALSGGFGEPALALGQAFTGDSFRAGGLKGFVIGRVDRNPSCIDEIAALGARVARVFFPFRRRSDGRGYGRTPADADGLQRLLARARERSVGLIVVGDFEGLEQPAFWLDPVLGDSVVEHWRWFAGHYGNDPALAALDLMNEPNPPWPSHDRTEAQATWRVLAERMVRTLRSEGITLPIMLEPPMGGSALGITGLTPLADPQIVYSIHFYTPHDITHQRVAPPWSRPIPYPAGIEWGLGAWDPRLGITPIDAHRLEQELAPVREFELRHRVPIHVGEFSCVRYAPRPSARRYVQDCIELFGRYGWSWTYHDYRGWPGWDAEIDSEDPRETRRSADAPVISLLRQAMR